MNKVIFAGGCFWCTEHDLRALDGVIDASSGYVGPQSTSSTPTYEDHSGYREGVLVTYDSNKITFKKLCQFFLDNIDPTDALGQFADRGESYKTAIYYRNEEEKIVAEALIKELSESGIYEKPIVVEIKPEEHFYKAEEYHQDYAEKNPAHYAMYRKGSGREDFVAQTCAIREEKKINWKD